MSDELLVGVDGGGTNCRVRVRRLNGTLVGEAQGGTANVFAGLDAALATIVATTERALAEGGLGAGHLARCHVGLGLAGANVPSVAEALHARSLPFARFGLETDAVTACRGAFAGAEGGISILGTGTAYCVRAGGAFTLLGGWGMLVSDQGSGADLGRRALAASLFALDGAKPRTPFCDAVLQRFGFSAGAIAEFAGASLPRDFGSLAPLVWDHAEADDPTALQLIADAVADIEPMLRRMLALGAPKLCLLGGQAPRYRLHLAADLRALLVEPAGDAMEGGIDLARSVRDGARDAA
ncbi:BadF/BadG/BcrA/BcrD ATPase family protein [Aureimonas sp. SK2]|uniref:BadF/BadG/BcrA/BcrD ATPase family protein n=1 Tax=Aureimonas sp. SK2 TaxID=3015992 RepID=UPI00244387FE|nr:BadF/BadG/BcrA/BcrD ATPase family protein [Aureimonas sp. SK2]